MIKILTIVFLQFFLFVVKRQTSNSERQIVQREISIDTTNENSVYSNIATENLKPINRSQDELKIIESFH
jgi:hypothetical protein